MLFLNARKFLPRHQRTTNMIITNMTDPYKVLRPLYLQNNMSVHAQKAWDSDDNDWNLVTKRKPTCKKVVISQRKCRDDQRRSTRLCYTKRKKWLTKSPKIFNSRVYNTNLPDGADTCGARITPNLKMSRVSARFGLRCCMHVHGCLRENARSRTGENQRVLQWPVGRRSQKESSQRRKLKLWTVSNFFFFFFFFFFLLYSRVQKQHLIWSRTQNGLRMILQMLMLLLWRTWQTDLICPSYSVNRHTWIQKECLPVFWS